MESVIKKRIFIGSSLESRDLAGLLQETLSTDFECVLWYEDFFSLGNHYYVRLTILVPTFVCDDVSFYKRSLIRRLGLKDDLIQNFRILVDPNEKETIHLYDIPSTILALFKTVNYVFEISEGNTEDTFCAKARALDDFYDNLQILISNDYLAKSIVSLERFDEK